MTTAPIFRRALLAGLAAAAIAAAADAQEMGNVTVNVGYRYAEGRILVNGVPVHRFAAGAPEEGSSGPFDVVGLGQWMRNGDNEVVVEGRATAEGGGIDVEILASIDAPPLTAGRIDSDGKIIATIGMDGLPEWLFLTSEPWTGEADDVLGAVRALHDAMAAKDTAEVDAMGRAMEEDMSRVWGPMPEELRAQFHRFIEAHPVQPLAADLTVESFYDGRLWVVSGPGGAPPVRVVNPADENDRIETGQYWIRWDGRWMVIR